MPNASNKQEINVRELHRDGLVKNLRSRELDQVGVDRLDWGLSFPKNGLSQNGNRKVKRLLVHKYADLTGSAC